jgi:hypothetical protein
MTLTFRDALPQYFMAIANITTNNPLMTQLLLACVTIANSVDGVNHCSANKSLQKHSSSKTR